MKLVAAVPHLVQISVKEEAAHMALQQVGHMEAEKSKIYSH